MRDFFDEVAALRREKALFATALVVGRRAPVSAHLGDRAIVHADGRMDGFVGGACSREIVRKQALEAIRLRRAVLVSIRPDAAAASTDPEHLVVPMTCVSEGAVDVYVEPNVPPRRLVVVGNTPVADAVTRVACSLDYDVVRVVTADETRDLEGPAAALGFAVIPLESLDAAFGEGAADAAAVVSTQGHYDEEALAVILRHELPYVGLVASRPRGGAVKRLLQERGVAVDRIRNPAGLDLGARTPPEVAVSILAEIVQARPAQSVTREAPVAEAPAGSPTSATAVDPVCRMEVEIATARHTAEVAGRMYYFCCASCRSRFVHDPAAFSAATP
ncbi:MAG TPA: XdhC family protein [Vicinamibacterales bacterium]|nr:XdhC family protein [Vicinamibacterales bacterium]